MSRRFPLTAAGLCLAAASPAALCAQIAFGAQATPMFTHADPTPGDSSRSQLRIVAPLLFGTARLFGDRVQVHVMLNGEGWTMRGGQLATGDWGEGFNDKRHPHTWAHELVVTTADLVRLPGGVRWSLTAGKGFAPFGTDDPMSRPALVFPVNHHWSQVLERAVLIGGARMGALTLEGGLFNGDEPERYTQWPRWSRFGDSWSARAFARPRDGLELQASFANIRSPEHRGGAGLRHQKVSVSARFQRRVTLGELYALGEWAYNSEGGFFKYYSGLAEVQLNRGAHRAYLRIERTDRPEETRISNDPFHSVRPHFENSNIGITRWTAVTAGYGMALGPSALPVRIEGIGEAEYLHVTSITGLFDPKTYWGRNDLWMISVALRVAAGARAHRMGRYGAAMDDAMQPTHEHHHF